MIHNRSSSKEIKPLELKNKVSFLQKVLDLNPNLLFIIDLKKQKVIFVNDRVEELLGVKADFVLEQGPEIFKTVLHPDDYQIRLNNLKECVQLQDEQECEVEVRFKVKDSGWQWFKIKDRIFERDKDGVVSHVIGTAQNIHEQKLWEEKQKEEQRRFKNAQEIVHLGHFERKLPGNKIYYSPEFYRILGLEPKNEEIDVEEFMSHVHPDDRDSYLTAIHHTHATGEPLNIITRAIRPDGSIRYIHRRAAIIKNDAGVPLRVYGTAQDITNRIEAEEERKRLENLMQATEVISGTGSYEADLRTHNVYFSHGLFRLFGYEPGEFEPSQEWVNRHSHPDDVPIVRQILEEAAGKRSGYTYTRRIYRKDGQMRIVESQGTMVLDEKGTPQKFIGLVQDITERKKAEEELQKSEERSRNLLKVLQNAPDSYLVLTPNLTIEMASDSYLKATYTTREQILGKHIFDIFPDNPEAADATGVKNLNASLQTVLSTKKPHRLPIQQYDVKDEDGIFQEKHWSPINAPVLNARGEVDYIIHRALDITNVIKEKNAGNGFVSETEILKTSLEEIKLQALQIQEGRTLLQSIFDASPYSIVLFNILYNKKENVEDFQYAMLNAFNFEHLGFSQDLVGKRLAKEFPNVKETGVLDQLKRTAETGIPADFETLYIGDGLNHYFRFRAKKVENRLVLTSEDITERKKSEETIQQMLNGSLAAITILNSVRDEQGKIIDFVFKAANKASERITGIPLEKFIDNSLTKLFPGVKDVFFETYVKVVETGEQLKVQRQYIDDNLDHWFDVSAVKNGDGIIMTFNDVTEQKKGEQQLLKLKEQLAQKATDKYRKIINSMDEGYCLLEMINDATGKCIDYRYLETNPVFEQQSGMHNVLGRTIKEMVPDIEPFWLENYSRVAKTGESLRFDDYSDPLERWFDVYAFRMDSDEEQHVAVIFKDITERKEAEERQTFLLKLNDALRPLADPNEIQYTAMQKLGAHLEVNRAYYAEAMEDEDTLHSRPGYLKNVSPAPPEGKLTDFDAKVREIFLEGHTLVLDDVFKGLELTPEMEAVIQDAQLQACIGVPLVKNGRLLAVVSVHQATARKWTPAEVSLVEEVCEYTWAAVERARAETALRLSQERLQKVLTIETVGVLFFDAHSNFLDANDAFLSMIGYTREEFTNGNLRSDVITLPEWMPRTREAFKELEERGLFSPYEKELKRPDGSRWWGLFAGKRLNEKECVEFVVDITEAKKTEEALIKAKELAEAATIAKEDFVSTMSHEIRTPLNAVIGLTNLLLDNKPREDQKENLDSLSFSARNLLALINDILDFSKLEAGKGEVEQNEFDLSHLIQSLKQLYEPQAKNKETKLHLNMDSEIPWGIVTDQLKLSQILHNLISNAVKFTRAGTINFSITVGEKVGDDLWLDFSIEDTGIGIPEEKLEYIFEKFSQAESSTVRQYGGTGLGLTITKLLLEILGSEIKVKSELGRGSKFYFRLPVKEARAFSPETRPVTQHSESNDFSQMRLLLVEDVEINRKIIIQFLQNWWQLQPDEAIDGMEAVEKAQQNTYDIILMDVRMPRMNGYEASRQIKKLPGYENIPILALTADKNNELQQAQHETPFNDLLTKPFEPQDLKLKIMEYLPASVKKEGDKKQMPSGEASEKNGLRGRHGIKNTVNISDSKSHNGTFEISRYKKMAGNNREILEKLIGNTIRALEAYKKEFEIAAKQYDEESISNLVHKNTTTVHYIQANTLASKIEEFRELLNFPDLDRNQVDEKANSILPIFETIIQGLKAEIKS